ncbi:MAG: CDP-alcohol phosphatidyltransferase family protein [Lentisphaerae bacterium]|nr:CDP-alcohol phosphatidyltransferase family protein [Lentisphaerota bacterium]
MQNTTQTPTDLPPGGLARENVWTMPNLLSVLRLASVPVLAVFAWSGRGTAFLVLFAISSLTDFADGYLARKLRQETEAGARLDSCADLAVYACLVPCTFRLWPDLFVREILAIILAVAGSLVPTVVGLVRYRHVPAFHTWGGKLSAFLISVSVIVLFAGWSPWPFRITGPVVLLAGVEKMVMIALFPRMHPDVPSIAHALREKREKHLAEARRTQRG